MTKLLKKGHQGIIAKICSLDVQTSKLSIPQDLQRIIDKHSKVFEDIPKGLPPTRNHDHEIHLIPGVFLLTSGHTDTLMPRRVKLSAWLKKCYRLASLDLAKVLTLHQW
jgi:hypothetical protein